MQSKLISLMMAGVILTLIAVAGITINQGVAAKHVSSLETDYPVYSDVADMARASDIVVRGTAREILPSIRNMPSGVDLSTLPAEKAANLGFLTTDIVFTVDQVLLGPDSLANTTIKVSHLGGEDAQKKSVAEHEPMSETGRSYVLFLKQINDGKYATLGGPQGRFLVENGKLALISEHAEEHPVGKELKGADMHSVAKKVKDRAKK